MKLMDKILFKTRLLINDFQTGINSFNSSLFVWNRYLNRGNNLTNKELGRWFYYYLQGGANSVNDFHFLNGDQWNKEKGNWDY